MIEGGELYFAILSAAAAIPVLSFVLLIIGRRFVKVGSVNTSDSFNVGDECYIELNIINTSILPIGICEVDIFADVYDRCERAREEFTVAISLKPLGSTKIYLKKSFDKCIYAEYFVKTIKIYDILGYFSLKKAISKSFSFAVIPKIQNIFSDYDIAELPTTGNEEFDGIREYRAGDRISLLHHKLSAKSDNLYSKNFSRNEAADALIVFNSRCSEIENLLEELVDCSFDLITKHQKFEIINIGYDRVPVPVEGYEDYKKHLVKMVCDLNTKIYNEYNSEYDSGLYRVIIEIRPRDEAVSYER
ncbi:MAG: DUF58 domain-containing protein [Ruminococcus sp.]|jgi:hypothetical protein|nr:DUF58 domain-containing protein [Ruminococcus sp.]